ncbi:hypothetical protein JL193_05790 [Polaribacter batillariae]|uniref:NVEALA protein n=1 Tax=Polaribacter batillariae TaxID=2808900 RepID=A0ABX7SX00_9FLAO|nr:hypothetical protein [Polaribacter batillariae]QTD38777.1 hypothetical protein JL193_05790 [Polaribacter batillariae]
MKSKILTSLGIAVIAMALFLNTNSINDNKSNLDLASFISLNTANAEGGYSCTVTSTCFMGFGTVSGSVSCSGSTCSRGSEWVKCDGKKTEC